MAGVLEATGAGAAGDEATRAASSVGRIVLASLVGTTIEFYDFYIYGTAAALVIGQTFFPQSAPGAQALNAFLTFGIAFLARPIGSVLFGHFGDRIGRKSTLVASMLVMGLSTTLIGVLPGYAQAGVLAPWLLCLLRFGQGVGLGGEWGGAALLATENAPRGRRAWFGMFPQLGPPLGFLMANGLFLALLLGLGEGPFVAWAWRDSLSGQRGAGGDRALCQGFDHRNAGLSRSARAQRTRRGSVARCAEPALAAADPGLARDRGLLRAVLYFDGVSRSGYGVNVAAYPPHRFPRACFASPSCSWRWRRPCRPRSPTSSGGVRYCSARALWRRWSASLCQAFSAAAQSRYLLFLSLALGVMGLTFAPLGALLPELFPTAVAYTGASSAYNLGGIFGASLAPYLAQLLLERGGLPWVGYYVSLAAAISFLSVLSMKETGDGS